MTTAATDLFEVLKKTKEKDKHITIVEALVEEGLLFIETSEMVYKITNSVFKSAILFARTGKIQVISGGRTVVKSGNFNHLVRILKEG